MKTRPNKVLAAAEAARIWTLFGLKSPSQLAVEDVAMALGVLVMDARLDSAIARLVRAGQTGLVRVSDRIREPGRRTFAIAHELGHWILHKDVTQLLACTDDDMLASYKASRYEVEASVFAGALLMPEDLFVRVADNARPTYDTLQKLADGFGTTLTATALRYVDTSTDYCLLVVSEKNRIRWWRASQAFEEHQIWLDHQSVLPRCSLAACFFRGELVPTRPERVGLHDWLGEVRGIYSEDIIEQAIPLRRYDQVLSMLWLP